MRWLTALLALSSGLVFPAGGVVGQTNCELWSSAYFTSRSVGGGRRITFVSRPLFGCADGTRIRADSAAVYEGQGFAQFFRNVRFEDARSTLTAERVHYQSDDGRLTAWENVVVTDSATGSVITGQNLIYTRAGEVFPEDQMLMRGERPHATIFPPRPEPDSLAASDSLVVADSSAAAPDSIPRADTVAAASDTAAAAPDTTRVGPDSLAVPPDTLAAQTDTLAVAPDTLGGRPDTVAVPSGPLSADTTRTPYEVDADLIELRGSNYFRAVGRVEIERDLLLAFSDTAIYDQAVGEMLLTSNARIEGQRYDLTGREIALDVSEDQLRRVVAREEAVLVGQNVTLLAPEIRVFLTQGQMERLVAVMEVSDSSQEGDEELEEEVVAIRRIALDSAGVEMESPAVRPRALAEDFEIVADSIEVRAPGEMLDRVFAVGSAHGESMARDSLNTEDTPDVVRRDWLEGDTIIASFSQVRRRGLASGDTIATLQAGDSLRQEFQLDTLWARGSARSLYRTEAAEDSTVAGDTTVMADSALATEAVPVADSALVMEAGLGSDSATASDSTATRDSAAAPWAARLAVNYVIGTVITIVLKDGEVDRMEVEGPTRGIQLQPIRRSAPMDVLGEGGTVREGTGR
jgi:lipopolysaccharide export system protein LptA